MNSNNHEHRALLQDIALEGGMLERGLLPDFSAQALAQLDKIQAPVKHDRKTCE